MKDTTIYLIRHAETTQENGIRNTNEDSQMINEKEILSVQGEEQSKKLSEYLVYNNTVLDITSPCLLKMTFKENKLINLKQIKQ